MEVMRGLFELLRVHFSTGGTDDGSDPVGERARAYERSAGALASVLGYPTNAPIAAPRVDSDTPTRVESRSDLLVPRARPLRGSRDRRRTIQGSDRHQRRGLSRSQ
jgi:hypothetical protein